MSRNPSPRDVIRPPLLAIGIGLILIIAALLTYLAHDGPAAPSAAEPASIAADGAPGSSTDGGGTPAQGPGPLGEQDGLVPDGVTAFDDRYPAIANLDGDLLAALRAATDAATRDGVTLAVTSGWRSQRYQQELLAEAVAQYASAAEAARWVAPADKSSHVFGEAVDVGPPAAAAWLERHGAAYGLCRVYGNEPWHFELRAAAASGRCPGLYADAAHDPRMQP